MFRVSHKFWNKFWVCGILLSLSACATAPSSSHTANPQSGATSTTWKLCPGGGISNAPASDANRNINAYAPTAEIHGVQLMRAPVNGCLSSGFGPRRGGAGSHHNGIDLVTQGPVPIYAGGSGRIKSIGTMRGYGRIIEIEHTNRINSRYAHLSRFARNLRVGDKVRRGDVIGHTGDSGNATAVHLHYEILVNGRARDPLSFGQ